MTIKILSAQLANQIAAGEVVERPASVIKELVENSIDAGATDILVEIDKGGYKRMLIRDNGKGIVKEQLSLALSRHATSKIADIDDLESITSLGFRGEALASISSVSRLTLTSKTDEQAEAWQAHCEGRDMEIELNPAAHPKGTSVEALDLFFNTPARRKFLRAEKTEFQHVEEIFKRIALSHSEIAFTLKHNGRVIHRYPAVLPELTEKRIAAVCGQAFIKASIAVHGEYQNVIVKGWCNAVGQGRGTNDLQYSFVNGRMMKDRVVLHAIRQAFEGMIDSQTYPAFVLFITMPPDELDINVHPAKHEVRFHQSRQVHDLIYKSLSDALLLNASTDEIDFESTSSLRLVDDKRLNQLGDQDSSAKISSVTTLSERPRHAYQQPGSDEPARDFISPLKNAGPTSEHPPFGSDVSSAKEENAALSKAALSKETSNTHSAYEPRARGYESKNSQGGGSQRGSSNFQNSMHGQGQVNKTAANNYQNLMQAGERVSSTQSKLSWLLTESKQLVFVHEQKIRFLPSFYLPAHVLYQQIQMSDVQQPLLMPVSVKQEAPIAHSYLQLMITLGLDVQVQAGKFILKQVPACIRQLPWMSILPKLLSVKRPLESDEKLIQYICFCWTEVHEFTHEELHNWFMSIAQSEQLNLVDKYSQCIDIPRINGEFNDC